ncbi:MAG: hypothetical protein GY938_04025 [Ketobacter sp.]|nr:hypothetical protein [Ketobacter sp.]
MHQPVDLKQLTEQQLRDLAQKLLTEAQHKDHTIQRIQLQNDQFKHEIAILRRH